MGKVITVAVQKGGVGKTTTCAILTHLLSQKGFKVLVIDMDSQGNATEMITEVDNIYHFEENTIFEAIVNKDIRPYIFKVSANIDIVPATDNLALLPSYLFKHKITDNYATVLKTIVDEVKDEYDYVIIDTPPSLSELTVNALVASDFVIVMFETSKFSKSALPRFFLNASIIKEKINRDLKVMGILTSMLDRRVLVHKELLDEARNTFGEICFASEISRTASIGRLSMHGFMSNKEVETAVEQYKEFADEVIYRSQLPDEVFDNFQETIDEYVLQFEESLK